MKKHIGPIVATAFDRIHFKAVAVLLAMAIFGIVAWQSKAQVTDYGETKQNLSAKDISSAMQARILADREDSGRQADLNSVPRAYPGTGTIIYAYDALNERLVSFDAATPGTYISDVALSGFNPPKESLTGIDFRLLNGLLYGIRSPAFPGRDRVVTIDISTGVIASVNSTNTFPTLIDPFSGLDFDPVNDSFREVGTTESNRRLNPNDSTLAGNDTTIRYAAGDPNAGANPNLAHTAYTMDTPSTVSTLYGIDITANTLVRVGGINGTPSPNNGELTTIGPLGLDPSNFGAMDIQQGTNIVYAALFLSAVPTLVRIDLTTGAASIIGIIGDGNGIFDGLAISLVPLAPPPPSPTPTPGVTPAPSPTPTPGPSPTPSPTPTPGPSPTPRPSVTPTPRPTPTPIPPNAAIVRGISLSGFAGVPVTINFELQARGGERTVTFTANFNPAVMMNPVARPGTAGPGANLTTDLTQVGAGRIGISLDSATPFAQGTHRFLDITFDIAPNTPSGTYPITYSGSPVPLEIRNASGSTVASFFEPSSVVFGVAAAGVEISGRVLTPDGRGLRNATVSLVSSNGNRRVVTTGSFGYYRFDDVEASGTYVVSVGSKRYTFSSRVMVVSDTLTDVDFFAN